MVTLIDNSENVARILRRDWFDEGNLLHVAFALRNGETYISVNRPFVSSFKRDVKDFVMSHSEYALEGDYRKCCLANLNVGDVRDIQVTLGHEKINIDVEVESRDIHVKSHAGIFSRYNKVNLKKGDTINDKSKGLALSADDILLKVRLQLLHMATCQRMTL